MIGYIKEIRTVDGVHEAIIETDSGPAVTANVMQAAGIDFHPLAGDQVVFDYAGPEVVVLAIFSLDASAGPGEWYVFSRDASGAVMAAFHLQSTGKIVCANSAGGFLVEANGQFNANNNFTVDP